MAKQAKEGLVPLEGKEAKLVIRYLAHIAKVIRKGQNQKADRDHILSLTQVHTVHQVGNHHFHGRAVAIVVVVVKVDLPRKFREEEEIEGIPMIVERCAIGTGVHRDIREIGNIIMLD